MVSRIDVKCFMNSSKSISPSPFKSAASAVVITSGGESPSSGQFLKHSVYSGNDRVPFIFLSNYLNSLNNSILSRSLAAWFSTTKVVLFKLNNSAFFKADSKVNVSSIFYLQMGAKKL